MNRLAFSKVLGGVIVVSGLAMSGALADNTGHDTQMACYASVHTECYGDGKNNCTQEVYNSGLDECDAGYGDSAAVQPPPSGTLKTPTQPLLLGKKTR
jgi:hypothetical protein